MKKLIIGVLAFVGVIACKHIKTKKESEKNYPDDDGDLLTIRTHKEVLQYAGQKIRLEGIYKDFDHKARQENSKRFYRGHVAIYLEDNWLVVLYAPSHPEAIRTPNERRKFKRKKVTVVGTIAAFIPVKKTVEDIVPSNHQSIPCMTFVESIQFAKK